jgi:hypothetical protein
MFESPSPLRDQAFMHAFLDVVIPPSRDGRMPGAGSLGLISDLADRIEADSRLGAPVRAGLEAVRDAALARNAGGLSELAPAARADTVRQVSVEHPQFMTGLTRHLYLAYYQHPRVLEGLGEPPRPPFPEGFEIEPTDDRLLEALRARYPK